MGLTLQSIITDSKKDCITNPDAVKPLMEQFAGLSAEKLNNTIPEKTLETILDDMEIGRDNISTLHYGDLLCLIEEYLTESLVDTQPDPFREEDTMWYLGQISISFWKKKGAYRK